MRQVSAYLLTVYVSISLSIGFLHTDEATFGNGHPIYESSTLTTSSASHNDGLCRACLFATGHILEEHVVLPRLFLTDHLIPWSPLSEQTVLSVHHSARAPPMFIPTSTISL